MTRWRDSNTGTGFLCIALLGAALCGKSAGADTAAPGPGNIAAALSDTRRPPDQLKLDAARKPGLVIAFAGVRSGDRIVDFMPGNAYFTRILSDIVGPAGHVYAFIPSEQIANCPAREIAGARAVGRDPSYANVTVLIDALAGFRMPEKLDLIWTAQDYHDLHDSFLGPADVAKLNKAFFDALRPGGVFLVIDHAADTGSGIRDTETLHRIDPARMRQEIEAAGFEFEGQSDVLRNPNDDHKRPVFDAAIRGVTDQVVFKFRKPL
jgi:predicted methyltransferase